MPALAVPIPSCCNEVLFGPAPLIPDGPIRKQSGSFGVSSTPFANRFPNLEGKHKNDGS